MSHALSRTAYPVLLTAMRDDVLGGSNTTAGFLVSTIFAAYMVGVAVVTVFSGRVEPKTTLIIGLCCSGCGFIVLALASRASEVAVGLTLTGLGSAGIWMSVPAIATGAAPSGRRGAVMGFLSSSIGLGLLLFGQAVRIVRDYAGNEEAWRQMWVGAAIFTLATLVLMVIVLDPPATAAADTSLNLRVLQQVDGWVPLTAAYLLYGLQVAVFAPFLGARFDQAGFSESHIALLYSLMGLAAIVGAIVMGRLSDRVGRQPVLFASMATIGISALMVVPGREPLATAAVILNGAASFAFPILVAATLRDQVSDRLFSNALGVITLIYGTSLVIGPLIGGRVGDSSFGFGALYLSLSVLAAVGSLVLLTLPPQMRRPQDNDA